MAARQAVVSIVVDAEQASDIRQALEAAIEAGTLAKLLKLGKAPAPPPADPPPQEDKPDDETKSIFSTRKKSKA